MTLLINLHHHAPVRGLESELPVSRSLEAYFYSHCFPDTVLVFCFLFCLCMACIPEHTAVHLAVKRDSKKHFKDN